MTEKKTKTVKSQRDDREVIMSIPDDITSMETLCEWAASVQDEETFIHPEILKQRMDAIIDSTR